MKTQARKEVTGKRRNNIMTELIHRKKRTKKINLKEGAKKLGKSLGSYALKGGPASLIVPMGKEVIRRIKNKKQKTANKKAVSQRLKKGGSVRKMNRGGRVKK